MQQIYNKFKDELLNSCIPFWLSNGVDKEYGGILNCLDREGKVYSEDKSVWMQGRAGWMFSYVYNNVEKKQEYLDFAKSCIATEPNPLVKNIPKQAQNTFKVKGFCSALSVFFAEIKYAAAKKRTMPMPVPRVNFSLNTIIPNKVGISTLAVLHIFASATVVMRKA